MDAFKAVTHGPRYYAAEEEGFIEPTYSGVDYTHYGNGASYGDPASTPYPTYRHTGRPLPQVPMAPQRESLSDLSHAKEFHDEADMTQPDLEDTYYPAQKETHNEKAAGFAAGPYVPTSFVPRRGIWAVDDRRAFAKQSLILKVLRIVAFIIIIGIIIALSVLILIVMFLRPPNIGLDGLTLPSDLSQVHIEQMQFSVNANIKAVVANPNYISATIKEVTADLFDQRVPGLRIGRCNTTDVEIYSRNMTTISVPCLLEYDVNKDKNFALIKEIASNCGVGKSKKRDLSLLLKLHLKIKFLAFNIPVSVTPSISMACPVSDGQIKKVLGGHSDILGQLGLGKRSAHDTLLRASPLAPRHLKDL
ncbi:hypothetical protein MVES1_003515 [Malassezia vespertilionis]|uniref:Late embryogenesis abundant protein LEA-2 subgroup domain-containing protein n=1 Tax=Malassezia vespertilionis TaxID=2020962 RepID=A0A2N1J6Z8_9BASI|nr:uncharacterized protein MVES1_003515 [Malassezia vespertilionis]PKI82327.1 hypothetical protein MVES_003752 [Malassezia vespertilionis]WFD08145.1 hypothetical protein MVES1_003515 [Malassezia vespertilionis]